MIDQDIEEARDLIREKVDDIVDRLGTYSDEVVEHMTDIYNLCYDADEDNWRDILEQIQNITREYC